MKTTDLAWAGQVFFQLPAYVGTPTATVNGTARSLTAVTSGVKLATPAAQDDTVTITFNAVLVANPRLEVFTPLTGTTIAPSEFCDVARVANESTIAALTITFPPNPSKEGQQFRVLTTSQITNVTWTGAARLGGPTMPFGAGRSATFEWSVAQQEWVFIN
uniref:Tail protein n=1 Tax=Ralstonia phage BOESR1 TaxID=3034917 RepID=A0AA49ENA7_9CAUD|nr:tail protein [Ralstonia phage BOESR1]